MLAFSGDDSIAQTHMLLQLGLYQAVAHPSTTPPFELHHPVIKRQRTRILRNISLILGVIVHVRLGVAHLATEVCLVVNLRRYPDSHRLQRDVGTHGTAFGRRLGTVLAVPCCAT